MEGEGIITTYRVKLSNSQHLWSVWTHLQPEKCFSTKGGQPGGDKTCLSGSKIYVEAEISKISTPPLGYDIIKPL